MIAYGVSHYSGALMKSWQLLFMVLGLATVVWAACLAKWLPDSPMKAKCFNEDEKRLMVERVRANETGIQNRKYKKPQIKEALTDPVVWCYILLQLTSTLIIGASAPSPTSSSSRLALRICRRSCSTLRRAPSPSASWSGARGRRR